tara:strand:- start:4776 stop:5675 length:900 start_codon:yes stop_codon:yes gene_type:complete
MPSINDRIGSQNVVRVLSNASSPPTKLIRLTDVESTRKTEDGMLLVWDLDTEKFVMTDVLDSSGLRISGIVSFTNETQSTSTTTGALVISGGVGLAKNLNVGGNLSIAGFSTFSLPVDINSSVDIEQTLRVGSGVTFEGDLRVEQNFYVGGSSEFVGVVTFRGGTINIGDQNTDDINISGEFISNLVPNTDATYDIGISTQRWRNARFSGLTTTGTLDVNGVSTLRDNVFITGFATVTEGIYYDVGDYNGPNGVAYFDNTGKLISGNNTSAGITTSNSILTVNASGIPTWTSTIDGGAY